MKYGKSRSWLYVPAGKKELYAKLSRYEADIFILDLEDGVAESHKKEARSYLQEKIPSECLRKNFFVRVNNSHSSHFEEDLKACLHLGPCLDGIILPKISSPQEVVLLEKRIQQTNLQIVPTIELLEAEKRVDEILTASSRISFVQFGETGDYSFDYGIFGKILDAMSDPVATDFAVQVLKSAKRNRLSVIDGAYLDLKDQNGLEKRCQWAVAIGFEAKAALHPAQIEIINQGFTPSENEIEKARRIVEAYEKNKGSLSFVPHEGGFISPPEYKNAKHFLKK